MTEKLPRKQTAISLKVKMELLKAVDEKGRSKTKICREFGIANSTLSAIIKNRHQLTAMYERSMFEPERKRMRTAKHKDLEAALLIWFKQARSQNIPVLGTLLMERANDFAKQMNIEFTTNPGWLERFKKRNGIVLKKNYSETNTEFVATLDCLTVPTSEFVSVDDDDECSAPIFIDEDILDVVQTVKEDPIDENSEGETENETKPAVPVPTTSEMLNHLKSMRHYLDAHSSGEMNHAIDAIEQFVENVVLKKILQKKTDFYGKKH